MAASRRRKAKDTPMPDKWPAADGKSPPSPMVLGAFLLLYATAILLLGRLLWPYVSALVLSLLLTEIFKPVFSLLNRKISASLASLLTCVLIVALIFVPLILLIGALSREAFGLYQLVRAADFDLAARLRELLKTSMLAARLQSLLAGLGITLEPEGLGRWLAEAARAGGLFVYEQASAWAANIAHFIFNSFLMVLTIFFLLIEHGRLRDFVLRISPLPDEQEQQLLDRFGRIGGAILLGNGTCGLIQGVFGAVAFALLGLGSPILWGSVMALLAFLPLVGTGLVMVPACLLLYLQGRALAAVLLFILYACLAFGVDYLLAPRLVGRQLKMHSLLLFLSVLGGLGVFGVLGIIYGPLIITAFLTLSEIYLASYCRYVKAGTDP